MPSPPPQPKPVPVPDEWTAPFWEAAARGSFVIQRCDHCQTYAHPPVFVCASCHARDAAFTFAPVSGRAVVRSWTVVHTSFLTAFADDVPYVLVSAELPEQDGLTYTARLVDGPDAPVRIGTELEVVFEPHDGGFVLPQLQLATVAS